MDAAIAPPAPSDTRTGDIELPVHIDDLAIDGTPPSVGDIVDIKMGGTVTRVVNDIAWVQPTDLNNKPIPDVPLERNDEMSELDRTYNMSMQTKGGTDAGY